jgi:hypothetical protein
MVEKQVTKLIRCDMCNETIQDEKVDRIRVRGYEWDLCHYCHRYLQQSLTFLTIKVGLSIEYSWSVVDYEVLIDGKEVDKR